MIRIARLDDAEAIREIYTPFVLATAISFEYEPPALATMRERIGATLATHPWLVYERQGHVHGYAYASAHRTRTAYQWSVDVSAYTRPESHRRGIGRALYTSLLALLRLQGFYKAYAGITLPNPASVGLHEAVGFRPLGVYREVGFKMGAWHDVGWWELELRPKEPDPAPPVHFAAARDLPGFGAALAAGLKQ
jgi:phosphinothricin acetyltransferase